MTPSARMHRGGSIPLLGFGTWQLDDGTAYDAVLAALAAGYRHLDTATGYHNEADVGRALRDSGVARDDVFVTTKLPPDHAGRAERTLQESLNALGVDQLDLWLIHWPPNGRPSPKVWRTLLDARERGLVRAVGVSNYDTAQLDVLIKDSGEAPEVNQIPWSPWDFSAQIVAEHEERGIVLEGYSPLQRSDLGSPVLGEIAKAHSVSPAQVVLRWHIDHGFVVIPKSATPERIRANADLDGFALNPDELARVDGLAG